VAAGWAGRDRAQQELPPAAAEINHRPRGGDVERVKQPLSVIVVQRRVPAHRDVHQMVELVVH
jgi:hypothetical protein